MIMLQPTRLLCILAIVLLSCPAVASALSIDIPELAGAYSIGEGADPETPWIRTASFAIPDSIGSLEGLRFVASGSWQNADLETCRDAGGFTVCDTLPTYTNLTLRLSADALGDCHFRASIATYDLVDGDELLFEVCPSGETDLNLLLGVEITAELFCDVAPEVLPRLVAPAVGTLQDVHLETVGAVPGSRWGWGAFRALYR